MSDDEAFASYIKFFEEHISQRPLSPEELAKFRADWDSPQAKSLRLVSDPMSWARAKLEFMRKLKRRQGTRTPDFEELYQRKAELDAKILTDEESDS